MSEEDLERALIKADLEYEEMKDKARLCEYKDKEIKELQERINKAIEYIEELGTQDGILKDYRIDKYIKEDLLNILRGDKE